MTDKKARAGSCLCGAVTVSIVADNSIGVCHCSMCRKWGGGPMFAIECQEHVRIDGEESITVYSSSAWAQRGFCSRCGSHLFYRLKETADYAIPVGLLDDQDGLVFEEQIFLDEKPAFYNFADMTRQLTGAEVFAGTGKKD